MCKGKRIVLIDMQRTIDVADKGVYEPHESWNTFSRVALIQFLKLDPRPVFVVDLDVETSSSTGPLNPLFINPTLYKNVSLYDDIRGIASRGNAEAERYYQVFLKWVRVTALERVSSEFQLGNVCWQSTLLEGRWNVLVANQTPSSNTDPRIMVAKSPDIRSTDALPEEEIPSQHFNRRSSDVNTPPSSSTSGARILEMNAQNFFVGDPTEIDKGNSSFGEDASVSVSHENGGSSIHSNVAIDLLTRSESRTAARNAELLAKISALATVAIYIVDMEGEILFCNDSWYEMSEHPRDQTNAMTWVNIFEDDEVPRVIELWRRVAVEQEPIQFQARLKRRWKPSKAFASAPKDFPTWISAWTYPDMSSDGKLVGACGVMTDVSEQKWSELLMQRQLSDAVERARLSEELSISAKRAADSERRFRSLSDMMPVGIWMSDESQQIIYANDVYFDLVPGARASSQLDWNAVQDEDMLAVKEAYRQLTEEHIKCSFELRLTTPHPSANGTHQHSRWVSVSVYPELHEDGRLKYLVGCMIDISSLKLAEQAQGARASDALESKRQLERFIDMTSHEMRNPLSAIIHSAEDVLLSFQSLDLGEISEATIASTVEAAQTIIYCTEHSTRIVDDILLVSKLESGLLDISPSVVRPIRSIKQALGMFSGEMKAADISQSLKIDESFNSLNIDYVHLDMSRVLQIFVNLVTNAIKFTRPEPVRQIDVYMKATLEEPSSSIEEGGIRYLDALSEVSKKTSDVPISEERTVYITVEVRDSGCGLTEGEQKNLFQRFAQAGKRTHVKYGGTGLGLFISRQLCEMQGGRIGLHSVPMKGSTFAFFVKAQKALSHEILADGIVPSTSALQSRKNSASMMIPPSASLSNGFSDTGPNRKNSRDSTHSPQQQEQHTILLVEDNLINQRVVAKKLRTQGYIVLVANHGLEALDHVRASSLSSDQPVSAPPISLILLDLEMPVMDGLTCIHDLRGMEKSGKLRYHVPVIAVTANARQEQIDQAKEAGMDDVVTKPFRINQLTPIVTQLIKEFPTSRFLVG